MGFFNNRSQINENDNDDDTLYNIIKIFNKKKLIIKIKHLCVEYFHVLLYIALALSQLYLHFSFHY